MKVTKTKWFHFMMGIFAYSCIAQGASSNKTQTYILEPTHTQVIFKASHLGYSYVYGQFRDIKGQIAINEEQPNESHLKIEIATNSLESLNADRDEHLRKSDFFDVKKFPKITFNSTKITPQKDNNYLIEGNLEMRGKTKKISFAFKRMKTGPDMKGQMRTGGVANFVVKRSDFGMNYMLGPDKIGDEIEIIITAEAVLQ